MNPPSALHGAMSRERKPFTYTPGGLDLSEIKSERMAKRLMRNAMNQGVPETTAQNLKSPPISLNMAMPNFNCLPVQVFPTFNLPSNPKSLLRTRSNPEPPKEPIIKKVTPAPQVTSPVKPSEPEINRPFSYNNNLNPFKPLNNNSFVNNTRPASMYEYNAIQDNIYDHKTAYGSDGYTIPLLPEKSYDAEYFQVTPQGSKALGNIEFNKPSIEIPKTISQIEIENKDISLEVLQKPVTDKKCEPNKKAKTLEDFVATNDAQKEVKVVQKKVNVTENQNGDANVEAAVTVKLPVKKTSGRTETKVEIENKILPDGTVEETKITTTKTTVDGKTDITTKTEKRILSKEEADAVVEVAEEEEEEEIEETAEDGPVVEERVVTETVKSTSSQKEITEEQNVKNKEVEESKQEKTKENGHDDLIVKEERQEITTTKKVVVVQSDDEEEVVEEEEEEEVEDVDNKKETRTQEESSIEKQEVAEEYKVEEANDIQIEEQQGDEEEEVEEEEKEDEEEEEIKTEIKKEIKREEKKDEEEIVAENKEEIPEAKQMEDAQITKEEEDEEVEEEEEYEEAEEPEVKQEFQVLETEKEKPVEEVTIVKEDVKEDTIEGGDAKSEEIPIKVIIEKKETSDKETTEEETKQPEEEKPVPQSEQKPPLREPSIPLEKVIDVEIKPIGLGNDIPVFTKSHTQNTEIITTTTDKPLGALSTQTEYNRIENIVTVNRTTKTLDQAYEQMIQPSLPPVKTYFAPNRDPVSISPQPSRPYQPVYPPEQTERRHSLLLERLSVERQIPSTDIYQNNYTSTQTEERQWSQEPQSEVLTVSNVKPSMISKNQQWYQQTNKENVTYNNVTPTIITTPSQQWNQPQPQTQPQYQSQPQHQSKPQPQYQAPQPQYQAPQPQYQTPQPQYQVPQKQYQQQYPAPQPQYQSQPLNTENKYTQNLYSGYSPKPTNWASSVDNENSYLKKDTTETYQTSTQQYSSSYVPPPWEQDSSYVADTANQNYYQPTPPTSAFTPTNTTSKSSWKPTPATNKFTKPTPTSYIPPAPNQSFVKPVSNVEPPKLPGRKTYYSEYERRYISVPESTYIPTESKYQAQPDPSPKYYYDNNEPLETVEPQWRKELREFTEKTSQTTIQTEQTSVRPPWEEDPKYVKTEYTPTPTWSQTLKPRSWRERSFESEYVGSKEWPKTYWFSAIPLGRGRPQSSYVKSVDSPIPERTRGVSVDRYNPNSYQSPIPSEHPPVQTYTLNPNAQQNYHNPNVPAYHARAAADNREQPVAYQQPRPHWSSDSRATPIQSRSFKYLQWITGTED